MIFFWQEIREGLKLWLEISNSLEIFNQTVNLSNFNYYTYTIYFLKAIKILFVE